MLLFIIKNNNDDDDNVIKSNDGVCSTTKHRDYFIILVCILLFHCLQRCGKHCWRKTKFSASSAQRLLLLL